MFFARYLLESASQAMFFKGQTYRDGLGAKDSAKGVRTLNAWVWKGTQIEARCENRE